MAESSTRDPPEKLLSLMLQCAVQAQLAYYNEFKSEVRAKWLESFLGHEHLRVERISARDSRIVYRGLSDGLRCSWRDYLKTMLRGSPQNYMCRYQIGTPDTAGGPGASAQAAAAGGAGTGADAAPWAAASASRAENPYLKKAEPQYREYTELVEPRRVAQGLVTICRQLADEWSHDLQLIADEGGYLADTCASADFDFQECEVGRRYDDEPRNASAPLDGGGGGMGGAAPSAFAAAVTDTKLPLPPVVYASFRAAAAKWTYQADLEDAPSPFRAENFDLLQRCITREASLSALAALEAAPDAAAPAAWLRRKLEDEWLPRFEAPRRNQLAGLLFVEFFSLAPTARPTADGKSLGFVDPVQIAYQILDERGKIARDWAAALDAGTPALLQSLLAADLEETLAKPDGQAADGAAPLYPGLPPDPEWEEDEDDD